MLKEIVFALWFFMPAGIANLVPVFAARLPYLRDLEAPIDFGKTFRGIRIFGPHKTWRGLVCGMVFSTLVFWLQQYLVRHYGWAQSFTSQVEYTSLPTLIVGPLFGFGALVGDAVESFFKRQRAIAPGHSWFPFDQTDYIIGGALATAPFIELHFLQYVLLVIIWLIVHLLTTYVGYRLKFKERPI